MWDGTGVDPWLPKRLAAEARITKAERKLYNAWWGSFSDWMVRVKRGVLSGAAFPDVHAVWAVAPLWAEHMDTFVQGPVTEVVGLAFRSLFGPDYRFDSRPRVTAYLAQVTNRMVRTPDHVFSVVASQVARSAATGESIPTIAARIDEILTTTGTENWRGRAVTVARTETVGALSAGRQDAFTAVADELGGEFEQQWLATLDSRVRPEHAAADGQRVPLGTPFIVGGESLMQPADPAGSAANTIQCRCGVLLLRSGEDVDMTGRGFSDADEWWADQIDEFEE